MKRKLMIILVAFLILLINFIIKYNKTERVLLVGEVMGFEIDEIENEENNTSDKVAKASFQSLGTISFINQETNQFVALGHSLNINSKDSKVHGTCYKANVEGFSKAEKNTLGYIIAYVEQDNPVGAIVSNNKNGVYGELKEKTIYPEIETASRYKVKKGAASIVLNLDEKGLKEYEVEIINISYISNNKNIKIKVKDEKLIELTGGIIQGMSGTPLIQNGKLIGVMNHVELSNPEEAYAIFIDKLI